jgi:hypothetical protein
MRQKMQVKNLSTNEKHHSTEIRDPRIKQSDFIALIAYIRKETHLKSII